MISVLGISTTGIMGGVLSVSKKPHKTYNEKATKPSLESAYGTA